MIPGSDSLKSLPEDLCSGLLCPDGYVDLSQHWTRERLISKQARYPETTEV